MRYSLDFHLTMTAGIFLLYVTTYSYIGSVKRILVLSNEITVDICFESEAAEIKHSLVYLVATK